METTIDKLLDQAVEKLPPVRKMLYKRLLKRDEVRADITSVLVHKLQADTVALSLLPTMGDEAFTASTPFSIDPDKLDKFLEVIFKYLPIILDIIFKFFV